MPFRHGAVHRPHWPSLTTLVKFPLTRPSNSARPRMESVMKKMFLAGFTVLSLAATVVAPVAANAAVFHNGSTVSGDVAATRMQQTGSYGA